MKHTIYCDALPNIPWQDKPAGCESPLWRYTENPIIGRNPLPGVARIFNSAVVPYEDGFIGVFRGEQLDGIPYIYLGRSADGIHWDFDRDKIPFVNGKGEPFMPQYAYDPRLVKIEDTYYAIWCQDFYGASIGIAKTTDFKTFTRLENPFIPFNRNAVLFPRKIHGMYTLLSRPSDSGHTPFGDIFLSQSPDMEFWGRHRHVMGKGSNWWESVKIGGGAAPIEIDEGWLLFYHGVTGTCNGFVYSIGGAILDRDEPSKVLYRCGNFLLTPEMWYEERGFVPNVCFPCATLQDKDTGRIAIYYGCADSYVAWPSPLWMRWFPTSRSTLRPPRRMWSWVSGKEEVHGANCEQSGCSAGRYHHVLEGSAGRCLRRLLRLHESGAGTGQDRGKRLHSEQPHSVVLLRGRHADRPTGAAGGNGDVYIYYAASDTRLHVATTTVEKLLDYAFNTPADPLRSRDCVAQRCRLIDRNLEYLGK